MSTTNQTPPKDSAAETADTEKNQKDPELKQSPNKR